MKCKFQKYSNYSKEYYCDAEIDCKYRSIDKIPVLTETIYYPNYEVEMRYICKGDKVKAKKLGI